MAAIRPIVPTALDGALFMTYKKIQNNHKTPTMIACIKKTININIISDRYIETIKAKVPKVTFRAFVK